MCRRKILLLAALLLILLQAGCDNIIPVVTKYDPERVYPGYTLAFVPSYRTFLLLDFDGTVLWSHTDFSIKGHSDFEVTEDGDFLFITGPGQPCLLSFPNEIQYTGPGVRAHHSILMLPWGNIMTIATDPVDTGTWMGEITSDKIIEIDAETNEIVWEWRLSDHVDPLENHRLLEDWSHANAIHYYEETSSILFNPRNLSTVYMISYPDGEILWSCGDFGDFGQGLFSCPHDPYLLENGNLLMFDNGFLRNPTFSRALELRVDPEEGNAEFAWEYRESPDFYSEVMGDANRLPNGNTLITDATNGRLIEVTSEGEVVWEIRIVMNTALMINHSIYKAERVPYDLWWE